MGDIGGSGGQYWPAFPMVASGGWACSICGSLMLPNVPHVCRTITIEPGRIEFGPNYPTGDFRGLHEGFVQQPKLTFKDPLEPPYVGPCPKCGAETSRIRFHMGNHESLGRWSHKPTCGEDDLAQRKRQHLHVYCETCLFDRIHVRKRR